MFLSGFFNTHLYWLEEMIDNPNIKIDKYLMAELVRKGLRYLVNFTKIQEENIYKISVEFWHVFTENL